MWLIPTTSRTTANMIKAYLALSGFAALVIVECAPARELALAGADAGHDVGALVRLVRPAGPSRAEV